MYECSVPIFSRWLENCANILLKAESFEKGRGQYLTTARLHGDMFPLDKQVIVAVDGARGCAVRLAGLEVPADDLDRFAVFDRGFENDFRHPLMTLRSLREYVNDGIALLGSFGPELFSGSEERKIVLARRGTERHFLGMPFLLKYALPNFHFHVAMMYAILRHEGVPLGKKDFEGPPAYGRD